TPGSVTRNFAALRNYLTTILPGPIADDITLEPLLAACWGDLEADDGGMESYKLLNRMEDVTWTPPRLNFAVERHGGTVMGSSRAELQHWEVDLENRTAMLAKTGHRQLRQTAQRIYVKPLVERVLTAFRNGSENELVSRHDQCRKHRPVAPRAARAGTR